MVYVMCLYVTSALRRQIQDTGNNLKQSANPNIASEKLPENIRMNLKDSEQAYSTKGKRAKDKTDAEG